MSQKRENKPANEAEFHKKAASSCFNKAWDFLDNKSRSQEDDRQMLLHAHTSRYHWGLVGTPSNMAVGDWQVSRVYSDLKQPELALLFAKSSLDTCQKNSLTDLLLSAYEGMARAYATTIEIGEARRYLEMARKQLELVTDKEDRKIYGQQIDETEALIRK